MEANREIARRLNGIGFSPGSLGRVFHRTVKCLFSVKLLASFTSARS